MTNTDTTTKKVGFSLVLFNEDGISATMAQNLTRADACGQANAISTALIFTETSALLLTVQVDTAADGLETRKVVRTDGAICGMTPGDLAAAVRAAERGAVRV